MPRATDCAKPPELRALEAKLVAWLNLSHLEKATVFVMVRTRAMAVTVGQLLFVDGRAFGEAWNDIPTKVSQSGDGEMRLSIFMMATTPMTTQSAGWA